MKKLFKKITPYLMLCALVLGMVFSVYIMGAFDLEYHVDIIGGGCQFATGNPGYKPGDTVYLDHDNIVKYNTGIRWYTRGDSK